MCILNCLMTRLKEMIAIASDRSEDIETLKIHAHVESVTICFSLQQCQTFLIFQDFSCQSFYLYNYVIIKKIQKSVACLLLNIGNLKKY